MQSGQLPDDRETSFVPAGSLPHLDDRETRFQPTGGTVRDAAPATSGSGVDFQPGTVLLDGRFRLETPLRGGAQGKAFRGSRVLDGAPVFVKIQTNPTGREDTFAKQIALRDKLLAINHPNLLRCYEIALVGEDLCEIYEWLDGQELSAFLKAGQPLLDEDQLHELVSQLAEGIHELHSVTSLSHRDLKPDNIRVVNRDGRRVYVIVDYGLVSQLDSGGATTVGGTRMYAPPEVLQRIIPNDPLLATWDWWSLGRIAQEAIDGIHPVDRLPQLFGDDLGSGKFGPGKTAVTAMFDMIMLENEQAHYKMRAGMVEMSQVACRFPRWLSLLRGLLTSRRRSRWGYAEVRKFLQGETPPDSYTAAVDIDGIEFENRHYTLPELATKLMVESSEDSAVGLERWNEAIELIYRGKVGRYISSVVQDAELARLVQRCQEFDDRDLGTALALAAISEGQVPPAVRGVAINTNFLLREAGRTGGEARKRIDTLLSEGFQRLLKLFDENASAELEEETEKLKGFRKVCGKLKVACDSAGVAAMVRLMHSPAETLIQSVEESRKTLNYTGNDALQQLFASGNLSSLTPFELRALALSISNASKHGFVSHTEKASQLMQLAKKMRAALALKDASFYMSWFLAPFHGNFQVLAVIASLASIAYIFKGTGTNIALEPGFSYSPNFLRILLAGIGCGILYASVHFWWKRVLNAFVDEFMSPRELNFTRDSLLKAARKIGGDANYKKELDRLNLEIHAVPHIEVSKFLVKAASLRPLLMKPFFTQVAIALIVCFGGALYAPLFFEKSPVRVAPAVKQQAPKKAKR